MITVTSNEGNHIHFIGSSITLICTVKLSSVAQESDSVETVNIIWTLPETINQSKADNEHSLLNTACNNVDNTHNNIFQCENNTYRSIVTVTPFIAGFYNCTATVTTKHPYYANMELSNGTRFTTG